ncbi:import inner membrane translocase subunit tim-50 mitochondrial precursor [Aaosphaeria arxii CBS 175.79]|uniref:Mitochondrial import inner membrane translocase subunit TIM50 n=1 Tax=Aaosphaeria arxii CBS 175.79 TaxID=1450172 RepID=A0A6A5XM57_9PLEO|nr:import inner membrane translocase subunit tim-50 mitochondrial precursor [Aaosphaeria arxii CBS 175.79]KAF2013927.1 import inner membrane translocase subunit tim-50 mitochondrial precursor [Aaosphaeria arxii CBS 175.79]
MLPRAAFRALRPRAPLAFPHTSPIATPPQSHWLRSYASNNRSSKNKTWKQSDPVKFDQSNKSTPNPIHPNEQPEFDAAAAPERNDVSSKSQTPADDAQASGEATEQPQKPLPDLRQGIPSTFGDEFGAAESRSPKHEHDPNNITEDPDKEPRPGSGREGGELPKSAYETSTDRRRNRVANWSYLATLVAGGLGAVYLGRNWDTEEEAKAHPDAPEGWSPAAMYNRAAARLSNQMGYYTEPTFPKLLPDMDPAPPMTLVLSLEDLLVHSEWTTQHGWRMAKRPGVDYFLRYLSQYYELVIFTSVRSMDADPIIRKLDPFRIVMWPLFREATRYEKGEYIKDLSCLNRDLSKTVIIDTDPAHVKLQPENAIILPKWKGEPGDKGLVALIPFLEYLAMMGTADVRQAIKSFEGKDIPVEFAHREAIAREAFNKEMAEQKAKKPKHSAGGFVMGALGLNKPQSDGLGFTEGYEQGKMLSDQIRERGQKQYEIMEKEIRENGEKWLKEMADEEKKFQEEQMKNMKTSAFSWFGASGPPPEKK